MIYMENIIITNSFNTVLPSSSNKTITRKKAGKYWLYRGYEVGES